MRRPPDVWCLEIDSRAWIHGQRQTICFRGRRPVVGTGRRGAITSVQLSKSMKLARVSCVFLLCVFHKINVAKASQHLKLQRIA